MKDRRLFKFYGGNKHVKNVIGQLAPYLECGWPEYLNILSWRSVYVRMDAWFTLHNTLFNDIHSMDCYSTRIQICLCHHCKTREFPARSLIPGKSYAHALTFWYIIRYIIALISLWQFPLSVYIHVCHVCRNFFYNLYLIVYKFHDWMSA